MKPLRSSSQLNNTRYTATRLAAFIPHPFLSLWSANPNSLPAMSDNTHHSLDSSAKHGRSERWLPDCMPALSLARTSSLTFQIKSTRSAETLLLQDSGFQHLHIPTVDFLYAPPTEDLHRGADFINGSLSFCPHSPKGNTVCKCLLCMMQTAVPASLNAFRPASSQPLKWVQVVRKRQPMQVPVAQDQSLLKFFTQKAGFLEGL